MVIYKEVEEFVHQICGKTEGVADRDEDPLDVIMDQLDDWLLDGCFEKCSHFLNVVPIEKLTTAELLIILTVTFPARDKLSAREIFYSKVQTLLRQQKSEGDVARILSGLKGEK